MMKNYYSFRISLLAAFLFMSLLALPYGTVMAAEMQDINTATESQLTAIKGIGSKTATAIIEYRDAHQGIKNIDELLSIRGLGEKTLAKVKTVFNVATVTNTTNPCSVTKAKESDTSAQ
ncbi:MAG: helix-hairpin-helix domain-containing protein [Mariprofundales bacterium]